MENLDIEYVQKRNMAIYYNELKRDKEKLEAKEQHKLLYGTDEQVIDMIIPALDKFIDKLKSKYYSIPEDDFNAIIDDNMLYVVNHRELIENKLQIINYVKKCIENKCKNYIRDAHTQKNGYDKEGNNLVSSYENILELKGQDVFEDIRSLNEYEEVEIMVSIEQECKRDWNYHQKLLLEYAKIVLIDPTISDSELAKSLNCDRRQIPYLKQSLLHIYDRMTE